jgi:SAM-dependent methyltransferase
MTKSKTRSPESIRHHYEVERELAARLRASSREQRTALFKTLYTELFQRVPDHPRLTRRETPEESLAAIRKQLRLLEPFLHSAATLVEFAPGDCRLAHAAASRCAKVIGIDISDQRSPADPSPPNFELVIYDGYNLDIQEGVADIAFSYQFLEHLHPDDVDLHFASVFRLLRPGGHYVVDTPHRFSGPHDVSRHFKPGMDCFHFQEWTRNDMRALLVRHGFDRVWTYRGGKLRKSPLANAADALAESLIAPLPLGLRSAISNRAFQSVCLAARKAIGV